MSFTWTPASEGITWGALVRKLNRSMAGLWQDMEARLSLGNGNARGTRVLTAHTDVTSTSTTGTTEETLLDFTIPAFTLDTEGVGLRITTWGDIANNGNSKTIRLRLGSTSLHSTTSTLADQGWIIQAWIFRRGASSQVVTVQRGLGSTIQTNLPVAHSEDLETDLDIKVQGTSPTQAGDVTADGLIVEFLRGP